MENTAFISYDLAVCTVIINLWCLALRDFSCYCEKKLKKDLRDDRKNHLSKNQNPMCHRISSRTIAAEKKGIR